ncbi:V-type proton ATPase subunit E [Sparassis crispa]|uniref:V-type proton ATPase subunit E n=1 Tax=Sparassis crispa TaxID=139825 RepID=A0A401GQA7_9APHY|nr:V-type proton ATPase subunit E [Sparassis crispa]GBE84340.1 V-type proton ATPase subunit E [Sparassis crispa]
MSARALNDDEVISEMNKMVAFIKQEAMEKAREIRVKADEEFAIEKASTPMGMLLRGTDGVFQGQAREARAASHRYPVRQEAEGGRGRTEDVTQSTLTNKSRLRLLQQREEHLQDLFSTTRELIVDLSRDQARYVQFLEGVITQGFLQLLEPDVTVHARGLDVEVVRRAADGAAKQYTEVSGRTVNVTVVGLLSDDIAGGVKLVSGSQRITLDNTLDERLRLLEDRMLPEIRNNLFGPNDNRKFYT